MEQCRTEETNKSILHKSSHGVSGRVLIIDEHPTIRKMLVSLINEKFGVDFCSEAESIDVASETLNSQTIDFALMDISQNRRQGARLAELLKLRCPKLPVMTVSIRQETVTGKKPEAPISAEQAERILAAIRYMQSLVRSGLSGFTVFVKDENNL